MKKIPIIVGFSIVLLSVVVLAESSYKTAFNALYGTSGTILDKCWTCHVEGQSYSHFNDYGADVRSAYNQSRNITTALRDVEDMDSDGDGDTNIVEITAGTLPGDPTNSTPIEKTTWGSIKNKYE